MEIKDKFFVIVKTNSHKNEFLGYSDVLKAYRVNIDAKPIDGEANMALEKFLSKYFKRRVRIISGFRSRKKLLSFET
jgi:uncharacterized protein (TIGR00251 family)